MYSHHMHNEHKTIENLISRLKAGENIALISDAGTPAISDQGFIDPRLCRERHNSGMPSRCYRFVPALVRTAK
jgi:16S rRNA (cytidine1402-2'-O)-methyltransferase